MGNNIKDLFKNIHFILKLFQLVICLSAWIIWYVDPPGKVFKDVESHDTISVAIIGYAFISFIFILTYIFAESQDFLEICFTLFGFVYHLVSTILIFILYSDYNEFMMVSTSCFWISMGMLTSICAVLCLIDFIVKVIEMRN
nr:uncharacterized protein LOC111413547 [Onthophagus taurus]